MQEATYFPQRERATGNLIYLRPEQICLPPSIHERKGDSPNAVIRLAESLKKYGVLEPLSVRLTGDAGGFPVYELVAGARRLAAAPHAGLMKLPCIVLPQDDKSYAIAGLIGSLRANALNMFEQASLFRTLLDDFCMTQEEIARKLSLSQSAVANKLRLLRFSPEEKMTILSAGLTERHARALLRIPDSEKRMAILQEVVAKKLNVAATESAIDAYLSRKAPAFSLILSPDGEISAQKPAKAIENLAQESENPAKAEENAAKGIVPRKFAIPDLRPLYNSIDHALAIFRKTGEAAECAREESEDSVRIVITIPKRA